MLRLGRFIDVLSTRLAHVAALLVLVMTFLVTANVVARYLIRSPIPWAMEVNQYLFCAVTLLASAYAIKEDVHVRVDLLRTRLHIRKRLLVDLAAFPIILVVCGLLVWYGSDEARLAYLYDRRSSSETALPLWPVWSIVAVGGFAFLLQSIVTWCRYYQNLRSDT